MNIRRINSLCSLTAVLCLIMACTSSSPKDVRLIDALPEIYPDYVGVTIPANIAPLDFTMQNDSIGTIDVEVKGSKGGHLHANGSFADFDINDWQQLLQQNKGGQLSITVCAEQDGKWVQYKDFTIDVCADTIAEWGITYRRIAPGYELFGKMGLYQRCLSNFEETSMVDNLETKGMCLNCHTANRTNPDQYVFHVRVEHGGTAIVKNGQIEILQGKNEQLGGAMVYPYWHPGGRYCAFSTNKTSQMFHTANPQKRIEVYDSQSDVFVYDTETRTIICDTLIMKKYWAENTPVFSPDGKWLYFTTAARQVYPTDYDKEKYSLCRVSFDKTTGRIGTKVDTLINTRLTGKSVTWPRPSYDGRFLMYTQADYGYFSVWHPEADLWLLDLESGESRPMDEVNSDRSESLHSWSTDSRWFLFTSRREDGLYTRVYLSYINEQGKATKPFLLPQRDPKRYYRLLMYSYNTPDFTTSRVETNPTDLMKHIEQSERTPVKVHQNKTAR